MNIKDTVRPCNVELEKLLKWANIVFFVYSMDDQKSFRSVVDYCNLCSNEFHFGDSDVGDFMMVTDFRFWSQNHYVCDFFRYVGDFLNILNRSPIS